jgi:hypothetical protein
VLKAFAMASGLLDNLSLIFIVDIIIIIIIFVFVVVSMDVSCHRSFLPGTSLESAVNPTAQA